METRKAGLIRLLWITAACPLLTITAINVTPSHAASQGYGKVSRCIRERLSDLSLQFDPEQFSIWLANAGHKFSSPHEALQKFFEWKSNYSVTLPDGLSHSAENLELRLVPQSFIHHFGKASQSASEFQHKIQNFYTDDHLYRGMSFTSHFSEEQILSYFRVSQVGTIAKAIDPRQPNFEKVFANFNRDMVRSPDTIKAKLKTQLHPNENYQQSEFVSFSRDRRDAEGFAQGALMSREHNRAVKSILMIQVRAPKVGAFDTRIAPRLGLDTLFDEKEVAVFGGVDPESIQSIVVDDIIADPVRSSYGLIRIQTSLLRRIYERVGYDRIRVTEMNSEEKVIRSVEVKLPAAHRKENPNIQIDF
jgi:hypothetical protein